jgi:hypothetical protein
MPTNAPSPRAEPSVVGSRAALAVMIGIGLLAIVNLGGALWIVVAPHSFFDQLGPFGAYNRHYLGDAAAFQGGVGLALGAALAWPRLRAGALAAALGCTGLHALNHWIDAGAAHAGSSAGVADALSLTALALLAGMLLHAVTRESAR